MSLSDTQIKEFENITKELGNLIPGVKELAAAEGGFAAIKQLPNLLKSEQGRIDAIDSELKKLRKQLAARSQDTGLRWSCGQPFVSDDCARAMSSLLVLGAARPDVNALGKLNRDPGMHQRLIDMSCDYLGIEAKTAMTATELPVPTIFIPQVVALVFAYGAARKYGTVFPLGNVDVRLPRLKAGEEDFAYLGAGTGGYSQTVNEKRVTAEAVTFTANKAGGIVRIPTELEQDTYIPVGQFLAQYIARQFAKLEDKTFFLADGTATYANQTGIAKYCTTNSAYLLRLGTGKTKPSDATLDDFRNMRAQVSAAVLGNMAANGQTQAAYYLHPTFEPLLRSFNKYPNFVVFAPQNGQPMLDGWPVRWIGVSQAYQSTAAADTALAFFGDASYWYLGERGAPRVEVSKEVYFATDELAMRALERVDVEAMAIDAMVTLKTATA